MMYIRNTNLQTTSPIQFDQPKEPEKTINDTSSLSRSKNTITVNRSRQATLTAFQLRRQQALQSAAQKAIASAMKSPFCDDSLGKDLAQRLEAVNGATDLKQVQEQANGTLRELEQKMGPFGADITSELKKVIDDEHIEPPKQSAPDPTRHQKEQDQILQNYQNSRGSLDNSYLAIGNTNIGKTTHPDPLLEKDKPITSPDPNQHQRGLEQLLHRHSSYLAIGNPDIGKTTHPDPPPETGKTNSTSNSGKQPPIEDTHKQEPGEVNVRASLGRLLGTKLRNQFNAIDSAKRDEGAGGSPAEMQARLADRLQNLKISYEHSDLMTEQQRAGLDQHLANLRNNQITPEQLADTSTFLQGMKKDLAGKALQEFEQTLSKFHPSTQQQVRADLAAELKQLEQLAKRPVQDRTPPLDNGKTPQFESGKQNYQPPPFPPPPLDNNKTPLFENGKQTYQPPPFPPPPLDNGKTPQFENGKQTYDPPPPYSPPLDNGKQPHFEDKKPPLYPPLDYDKTPPDPSKSTSSQDSKTPEEMDPYEKQLEIKMKQKETMEKLMKIQAEMEEMQIIFQMEKKWRDMIKELI